MPVVADSTHDVVGGVSDRLRDMALWRPKPLVACLAHMCYDEQAINRIITLHTTRDQHVCMKGYLNSSILVPTHTRWLFLMRIVVLGKFGSKPLIGNGFTPIC